MKRGAAIALVLTVLIVGSGFWAKSWFDRELAPTAAMPPQYIRFDRPKKLDSVLTYLYRLQIVRDPQAMQVFAWFKRRPETVPSGTYQLHPGMTAEEVFTGLTTQIHQNFRFPETNWARRDANLLQQALVCQAKDYLALVNQPGLFQRKVDFPLPSTTLEGYLFPDTYDLPPLTGATTVIDRQLKAFDNKVVKRLGPDAAKPDTVCIASLVELETGTDEDRPMIAGVIMNRIKKGIPLQIDSGILYALGKWRRLYFKDYKNVNSPYNLYLHKGLPPTPICSPSFKSIVAALHPAKHEYLYYVALPNGHSLFAKTPAEHLHNIRLRKFALALIAKAKALAVPAGGTTAGSTLRPTTAGSSPPEHTTTGSPAEGSGPPTVQGSNKP